MRALASILASIVTLAMCTPAFAGSLYVDVALSSSCVSRTYNVNTRECRGGDRPAYSTFDAAIEAMEAGDTLFIRGGIYRTPLVITKSGTELAHLRFAPYPGESVLIDLGGTTPAASGIDLGGQHYIDIEGLVVYNAQVYGLHGYRNSHITVSDSEFAFSYQGGLVFENGLDITVTRSRIHHNNNGGTWHEAVTFAEVDQFSITDSEVYENNKEGIDAKYGARRGLIARNRVYRNEGPNIYLDAISDTQVSGNRCYDTRSAAKACIGIAIEATFNPSRYQTSGVTISNNVLSGSGAGIFFLVEEPGLSWARFDDVRIEYNTIVDNSANTWGGIYILSGGARNFGGGNTIRNNIIVGNGKRGIRDERGVTQLFAIDHNLFQSGESSTTLGANAVVSSASPFVNRAERDFHLSSGSPARQAARPIADLPTDFDESPRPAQAPDIGAFQYVAPVSPVP